MVSDAALGNVRRDGSNQGEAITKGMLLKDVISHCWLMVI